jgi:hypothetical protein
MYVRLNYRTIRLGKQVEMNQERSSKTRSSEADDHNPDPNESLYASRPPLIEAVRGF